MVSAWVLLFFVVVGLIHAFVPYPIDNDTAYHYSVGQLIKKHGVLRSFPWTTFSWQNENYADKEFLFHLLFIPFEGFGFITAQRIVGILCGSVLLACLYFVLRAERVKFSVVWALLPLTSSAFIFRFAQVRPHLLSIALALVLIWAYARQRKFIAAIAALMYPLSYVAFWQIPLILIVSIETARLVAGERIRWETALTVLAGIVIGVIIHPNTVNLVAINWIHMSDILVANAWTKNIQIEIAGEFHPYTLAEWGKFLIGALLLTAAALALGWKNRFKSPVPLGFALAALIFGLLTAKTNRFLEYFVPFSVLALAVSARGRVKKPLAPPLLVALGLYTALFGTDPYRVIASLETRNSSIDGFTERYFREHIPVGEQVFTPGWDYTGNLMVALPERRFVVAADPTLLYKKDPKLFEMWRNIPLSPPPDTVDVVRSAFKSRFVISRNFSVYLDFFDTLRSDPRVRILYADSKWILYDLGQPDFADGAPTTEPGERAVR